MSIGTGTVHTRSTKQKLNVKSSIDSEILGTSKYMPYNTWTVNFMDSQGYKLKSNSLFQDNQSAMKMEINGRRSCTGNSRHINIRYFYVKDLVDKNMVQIQYCPTTKMLADFFAKPLQGSLFRFYRDIIMGYVSVNDIIGDNPKIKERVENWKKFAPSVSLPVEEKNLSCVRTNTNGTTWQKKYLLILF